MIPPTHQGLEPELQPVHQLPRRDDFRHLPRHPRPRRESNRQPQRVGAQAAPPLRPQPGRQPAERPGTGLLCRPGGAGGAEPGRQ